MFDGKLVLIVEDEGLVAADLAFALEELGGRIVGPVATVAEALILLEEHAVAAAVLDGILADRDVTPVALLLVDRGVPFVIHTGTALPDELAALHPALTVLPKPQRADIVMACLLNEMRGAGSQSLLG
ncbi:MAG: response regulator [Proteobacteria bacterium]|nr:response regulator [Pseudomonadota bacterium]